MLDSGSGLTFVTEHFVKRTGTPKHYFPVQISGFQQTDTPIAKFQVEINFLVTLPQGPVLHSITALVVKSITDQLPTAPLSHLQKNPLLKDLQLADPTLHLPGKIDILIGNNFLSTITKSEIRHSADWSLCAIDTHFGWVVFGRCQSNSPSPNINICCSTTTQTPEIQQQLLYFLEDEGLLDNSSLHTDLSADDMEAEESFKSTHFRLPDGRFSVTLPRKKDPPLLGHSRSLALRRHNTNITSMKRKGIYSEFQEAIWDYAKRSHAEKVPPEDLLPPPGKHYYFPTLGVIKSESTTTKFRVVFDGSACTSTGASLNDTLLKGPNIYPKLPSILITFRTKAIGMTADIGKMFREIALDPSERDYHRFLLTNEDGEVEDWRMLRLTFGVASSPFLATRVIKEAAQIYSEKYPLASKVLQSNIYVDDCLTGADTEEEAQSLRSQLNCLLQDAGMTLRKWRSSSTKLLQSIPIDLRETEPVQVFSPQDIRKALGVHWNTVTDTLHVPTPPPTNVLNPTKRQLSSAIARVYDILGLFTPAILQLKLLLQQLWKTGCDWDQPPPDHISQDWIAWQQEASYISAKVIPRFYYLTKKPICLQLHGFADASNIAYGAVIYLRATFEDYSIATSLVTAKSKVVSHSKPNTTPRLELCAALLLSKLLIYVAPLLDIPSSNIFAWSDSSITLSRIFTGPAGQDLYVRNRISKTIHNLPKEHWRHVPTDSNPADLASRGVSLKKLSESILWWKGPDWLSKDQFQWPNLTTWRGKQSEPTLSTTTHSQPKEQSASAGKVLIQWFTSYRKALRVYSWLKRFTANARLKDQNHRNLSKRLSISEIENMERILLVASQLRSFPDELLRLQKGQPVHSTSPILQRHPMLGKDGLMRVGGRLQHSSLPYDSKRPVILHGKDPLSRMIAIHLHNTSLHTGPTALMGIFSLRFDIVGAKQLAKDVSSNCYTCRRHYARTASQLMGQLPAYRITVTPPFHHSGVDFAGPLQLRMSHVRKPTILQGYLCIFVCLTTKAVHIEVVMDLSTEAFVAAFKRFVGRRGRPALICSDNGTNFTGAHGVLEKAYQHLDSLQPTESLHSYLTDQRIQWRHSPARSPHFGGFWEAGVRQMKELLHRAVKPHRLTPEELATIAVEVEAMLNSRPLARLDSTPTDGTEVLTPAHFLVGRSLQALPTNTSPQRSLLRHWQLCQQLSQHLWDKWSKAYLQLLQKTAKWHNSHRSLKVGDVVLLKDDALFDRNWPTARVTEIHHGTDGLVRVATVRTAKGTYRRSITKLVPLVLLEDSSTDAAVLRAPQDVRDRTATSKTV